MVLLGLAQPGLPSMAYYFELPALATTASVHRNGYDTPIEISDNSDFTLYGFSGNGSIFSPYLLENQDIDLGLYIHNTSAYFVIRYCNISFENLACEWISNGVIEECSFASTAALYILSSENVIVNENVFSSSELPEALWMGDCRDSIVSENEFLSSDTGLTLEICNNTIISDNHFINDNLGLILDSSAYVTVIGNEFTDCGLEMQFWNYPQSLFYSYQELVRLPYNITNNLVNGKDIGFFQSLSSAEVNLAQYGQAILLSCNDTLISGGDFQNCSTGIQIIHSNNCTVESSNVSECYWGGVHIQDSTNITLENCFITHCHYNGVYAEDSTGITLRACHVVSCSGNGVSLAFSPFFTAVDCVIEDNLHNGINPTYNSSSETVIRSIIRGNLWTGLYLSDNSTSIGNTITRNYVGINIFGSHCFVYNNTITYNNSTGVLIEYPWYGYYEGFAAYNRIYNNSIGWNGYSNAIDYGRFNSWDDGSSVGNSWSDYYGIGVYEIEWTSIDHYPSILPNGSVTPFQIHIVIICALVGVSVITISILLKRRIRMMTIRERGKTCGGWSNKAVD